MAFNMKKLYPERNWNYSSVCLLKVGSLKTNCGDTCDNRNKNYHLQLIHCCTIWLISFFLISGIISNAHANIIQSKFYDIPNKNSYSVCKFNFCIDTSCLTKNWTSLKIIEVERDDDGDNEEEEDDHRKQKSNDKKNKNKKLHTLKRW